MKKLTIATSFGLTVLFLAGSLFSSLAYAAVEPMTVAASDITQTGATLNGKNGDTAAEADGEGFWYGPTSAGSFTPDTAPAVADQLPDGWSSGFATTEDLAPGGDFSMPVTGLDPDTTYYFVAWALIGDTWYPGEVLEFDTESLLSAQDFGVMDFSGVKGYTAGFHLDGDLTDAEITVKLYSGSTLLQTNTSMPGMFTGSDFSGPFDVSGTFDYVLDGYWSNAREDEYGANLVPTKVVATVTLPDDTVLTAENTNLTGDPSTVMPTGSLAAQDFGVMDASGVKGYTAGFGLTDADLAGAKSVVVELFSGSDLLQTNTAILPKFNADITGTQFSSPFDVNGTFDYAADGYWSNERESEYGKNVVPTKVVATITLKSDKIVTAENTNLTGDTTTIVPLGTFLPENFNVVVNSDTGPAGILNGYSTGFALTDAMWADAVSVVVKLYAGSDLLQTNTANFPLFGTIAGSQITAPFDVSGTFDYALDGYWTNTRENEYGQTVVPTKVVAVATLANGKVMTAQNTNLTDADDAEDVMPVTFEVNYAAGENGTISGYESQNVVEGGNSSSVTAVPNDGYHFVEWSDGSDVATRSETNVTEDLSFTASFARNSSGGNSGSGRRNPATPATPAVPGESSAIPATPGEVLGAETGPKFIFTLFLKMGPPYGAAVQAEVMELQKFLNTAGYGPLVVDGKFGPITKAAVVKFQLANGLKGDGIVGPLTRAVLNK